MQEASVGWDPQSVYYRGPGWAVRIYTFYLLFVICYAALRTIQLAWNLRFKRIRISNMQEEQGIDTLAHAALVEKYPNGSIALLDLIAPRFHYLVSSISAHLKALRRLSRGTVLAAGCAFLLGVSNTFRGISINKATGIGAVSGGLMEALDYAVVGLVISLCLYLIAAVFEAMLARRVAKWNYIFDSRRTG